LATRISRFGHAAIVQQTTRAENADMPAEPNEVVVRRASLEDAEPICAIYNAGIAERGSTFETEPRSAGDFKSRVNDAQLPLLVGDAGEGVIGWAGLASYSSRPCYAGIGECSVYVAVDARGRGVGTALTEGLASAAEESGFHKLIGKLFTDNAASLRLVERCRFSSVGLHRRHGQLDGNWRDVLVVERLLTIL
jgi:L-amino acid N-acyltransferase YncA